MQIKKYVANSIQEALRQIKNELGPEALILSVNNIKASTGPLALMSPARVEVTAAIDEAPPAYKYPANALPSVQDRVKNPGHSSNRSAKEEQRLPYKEEQKLPLFQRGQGGIRGNFDQSPDLDSRQNRALQGRVTDAYHSSMEDAAQSATITEQSLPSDQPYSRGRGDKGTGRRRDGETGRCPLVPQSPCPPVPLPPHPRSNFRKVTQGAKHMAQSVKDALKGSLRAASGYEVKASPDSSSKANNPQHASGEWESGRGESGGGGDRETGRQGDRETGRQGDRETGRGGDMSLSPCPPVPRSPSPLGPQSPSPQVPQSHIASLCHLLKKIGLQEDIVEHIIDVLSHEIPRLNNDKGSFPSLAESYTSSQLEGLARNILQQLVKTSGSIDGTISPTPLYKGGDFEGEGVRGRDGEAGREGDGETGRYAFVPHQSPSPPAPQSPGHAGPKYVALVGPTGTGKTTTIAKLSAELLLKRKKKVGLITIDTYRVGAMEQLNTYAGIMNIPVKEASTFEQMRKAVLQYQDQDVVLIDTAGFSHHDREHLQLLNAFLAQVINPEIHLVLSTNTDEKELIHISQSFNLLHYEKLLFTKLDESSYPGTIFNHMVYTGKPISYITTGQKVPEDIEVATQAGIINLMFQGKQFYPLNYNTEQSPQPPFIKGGRGGL